MKLMKKIIRLNLKIELAHAHICAITKYKFNDDPNLCVPQQISVYDQVKQKP